MIMYTDMYTVFMTCMGALFYTLIRLPSLQLATFTHHIISLFCSVSQHYLPPALKVTVHFLSSTTYILITLLHYVLSFGVIHVV